MNGGVNHSFIFLSARSVIMSINCKTISHWLQYTAISIFVSHNKCYCIVNFSSQIDRLHERFYLTGGSLLLFTNQHLFQCLRMLLIYSYS